MTKGLNEDGYTFEALKEIESLAIIKKQIKSDWATIVNQVVLIPSESFRKLVIETDKLTQSELQQLGVALKLMKQEVSVEIRCQISFALEFDSNLVAGTIVGYKRIVFEKVKTHQILRYISETSKTRIDLFAKSLVAASVELDNPVMPKHHQYRYYKKKPS